METAPFEFSSHGLAKTSKGETHISPPSLRHPQKKNGTCIPSFNPSGIFIRKSQIARNRSSPPELNQPVKEGMRPTWLDFVHPRHQTPPFFPTMVWFYRLEHDKASKPQLIFQILPISLLFGGIYHDCVGYVDRFMKYFMFQKYVMFMKSIVCF